MDYISRSDSTVTFLDSSPSELMHNTKDALIFSTLVNFFHVDLSKVNNLSQYKNIRGLSRKLKRQQQIIDLVTKELIVPVGSVCWNYQDRALENGRILLIQSGYIEGSEDNDELISIADHEVSIGHLKSLAWFSIALTLLTHALCFITKAENKKRAFIVLDLISGDNRNTSRSFEIVKHLLNKTDLDGQRMGILEDNGLKGTGLVYGHRNGSTKGFKNEFGLTLTDWITSSFYNLLKYDTLSLSKESSEYQLSRLARTLVELKYFSIKDPLALK